LAKIDLTDLTQPRYSQIAALPPPPQLLVNGHNKKKKEKYQTRKKMDKIRENVSARRKMKKSKNLLIFNTRYVSRKNKREHKLTFVYM